MSNGFKMTVGNMTLSHSDIQLKIYNFIQIHKIIDYFYRTTLKIEHLK